MFWTAERIADLKNRYTTEGPTRLASEYGVSRPTVMNAAVRHGLTKKQDRPQTQWSETRLAIMRERYLTDGSQSLAKEWGDIKPTAIIAQAWRMGITKKRVSYFEWTEGKDAELARRCVLEGYAELAREWGLSYQAVASHAADLGLHTDVLKLARWFYPPGSKLFLTRKRDRFFRAIESIGREKPSKLGVTSH